MPTEPMTEATLEQPAPAIPRLLASCWTTGGDAGPYLANEISPFDLRDRVRAAAAAGYRGFGFLDIDLAVAADAYGLDALAKVVNECDIVDIEVEMLNDWFLDGDRRASSDKVREQLLQAADLLGARHLKCGGDITGATFPLSLVAAEFAQLCEEFAAIDVKVGYEIMPFGNISTIRAGVEMLELAGQPATGGLFLDLCHVARAGVDFADIVEVLPPDALIGVELDDASKTVVGTLLEDTLHRRRLCGQGDLDVTGFIRAVRTTGYTGPWGVEILSDEHRRLPLQEQASRSFDTTLAALQHADPVPE